MSFFHIPAITVQELARRRAADAAPIVLDVREPLELTYAALGADVALAPLSLLAEQGPEALPPAVRDHPDAEVVVMCHHGSRSAQVVAWLRRMGWTNVHNLEGGIHAYALLVDPSVGVY